MRIVKRLLFFIVIASLAMSIPFQVFAQPIDPCTDPADPCPIDSNLIVLFAAAFLFAAKKAYQSKKTLLIK